MRTACKKQHKGANRRRVCGAAFLMAVLFLCCACGRGAQQAPASAVAEPIIELTPQPVRSYPRGELTPLEVERAYEEYPEGHILYPKVISGPYAERINDTVCNEVLRRAAERERDGRRIFTEYSVETNAAGLFSIVMAVQDLESGDPLFSLPLTFDAASGELCAIEYYFDPGDESWRGALSALVEEAVDEAGLSLLRSLPDIPDEQSYYIKERNLVLLYRSYEITNYTESGPAISIPIGALADYLAPQSPLLRLVEQEG